MKKNVKRIFMFITILLAFSIKNTYATSELPVVNIEGDLSRLTTEKNEERFVLSYTDEETGLTFTKNVTMKLQGGITLNYDKHNFTIKIYSNDTYEKKEKIDMGKGWGKSNKYTLKANITDRSQARNIVTARLAAKTQKKYGLFTDKKIPNNGLIDGYPVQVNLNGEFYGLYTWNIPKDKWMWNLDDKNENNIAIQSFHSGKDYTKFKKAIEDNVSLEDAGWEITEGTDTEENIKAKFNRLLTFISESTDEEFKEHLDEYINKDALLNYTVYLYLCMAWDNAANNITFVTYDGNIWYPTLYDLDHTYGRGYYPSKNYYWLPEEGNVENDLLVNLRDSVLFNKFIRCFPNEFANRWFELRENELSYENIVAEFENFIGDIPPEIYELDKEKWGYISFYGSNDTSKNQIYGSSTSYLEIRLPYVDEIVRQKKTADIPVDNSLPIVNIEGDISTLTTDKNEERFVLTYTDTKNNKTFTKNVTMKFQGEASLNYPKHNFTIKIFSDDTYEKKEKIDMGKGWGKSNKYCLKSNVMDPTQSRNIITSRLAAQVQERFGLFTDDKIPNNGQIDGYPVQLNVNGEFYGLYTWNIPKDAWMWNISDKQTNHIVMQGNANNNDYTLFKKEIEKNVSISDANWEIIEGSDSEENIKTKFNRLLKFVSESSDKEFKEHFEEYINKDALLNYLVFVYVTEGWDNIANNMTLVTYDGKIWYPTLYDLDSTWGRGAQNYNWVPDENYTAEWGKQDNVLIRKFLKNFSNEFVTRYFDIREKELTVENIKDAFDNYCSTIPNELYEIDKEKWENTSGYGKKATLNQIHGFIDVRLPYIDGIVSQKKSTDISYTTHVQSYGWQDYVSNGEMSGTSGQAKRLEGIKIKLENQEFTGDIEYRTHIQSFGWEETYKKNDDMSGTEGQAKRLEAIQIRLTGEIATYYDVYYRVHAQSFGWLGWARNDEEAGTAGFAKRLEGIEIKLVPKGTLVPGYGTEEAYKRKYIEYTTHVQSYGWQDYTYDGNMAGTSGEAKRLEAIKIKLKNQPYTGDIEYRTHIQSYGWEDTFRKNDEISGTSGQAKRLEAIEIKLTGNMATHYDIYYRVHAQSFGWLAWAKNGEQAGTAGLAKRLEGIEIVLVNKGEAPPVRDNQNNERSFIQNS